LFSSLLNQFRTVLLYGAVPAVYLEQQEGSAFRNPRELILE